MFQVSFSDNKTFAIYYLRNQMIRFTLLSFSFSFMKTESRSRRKITKSFRSNGQDLHVHENAKPNEIRTVRVKFFS